MAAGQEAELSRVQAPGRYTQAVKSVFQAYHQGPPGWGQGCRVPCGERGEGVRSHRSAPRSPPHQPLYPPTLPSTTSSPAVSLTLVSYLSSLRLAQGCPRPPDAGTRVRRGWPSAGRLPSTAKRRGEGGAG